jgi:hypothetical protein
MSERETVLTLDHEDHVNEIRNCLPKNKFSLIIKPAVWIECDFLKHRYIQIMAKFKNEHYLCQIRNFIHWTRWYIERIPISENHIVALHNPHGTLNNVKYQRINQRVFCKVLDEWDVASLCQIPGVRISDRQFFPREGVGQCKKMFDVMFGVTVMGIKYY